MHASGSYDANYPGSIFISFSLSLSTLTLPPPPPKQSALLLLCASLRLFFNKGKFRRLIGDVIAAPTSSLVHYSMSEQGNRGVLFMQEYPQRPRGIEGSRRGEYLCLETWGFRLLLHPHTIKS